MTAIPYPITDCLHCKRNRGSRARGLCYGCYREPTIREQYPKRPGEYTWKGTTRRKRDQHSKGGGTPDEILIHDAEVELLIALLHGEPTGLTYEEWRAVLGRIMPRHRIVVVLRLLHDQSFDQIGQRLSTTHARVEQVWQAAMHRLGKDPRIIELLGG